MLEIQKYLKSHSLISLEDVFGIHSKIYGDRVILNYRIDSKPKFHPIVCECRSLILSLPDYNIISRSFDRFFNYGEGDDKDAFNWDHSIIFNKLDGSLINVYHDGIQWNVSTRGTAFGEGTTPMGKQFKDLFIEAIGTDLQNAFKDCLKNYTYIFEVTSPENRIVTAYKDTKATLLAIRNKETGEYIDYNIINTFINFNDAKIDNVESYNLKSANDILNFVESRDQTDEGVVCFDTITQKRIKIKNSSYVAIHHLRGNEVTTKSIISLLLKGETDEYLVYFPEDKKLLSPFIEKYNKLYNDVIDSFEKFKDIENQKEFAITIKDLPYKAFLFLMRKGATIDSIFNVNNINTFIKLFENQ